MKGRTGHLVSWRDSKLQCWAEVHLQSGEKIFISIARSGVVIRRKGFWGMLGNVLLYEETDISKLAVDCEKLDKVMTLNEVEASVPDGMVNPVLMVFTKLAVNSESANEIATVLATIRGSRDDKGNEI